MHQDRRVEPLDVLAVVHHRAPPALLDVFLELDAQRAVVPYRAEAAVDLRGLEHEAAPLGQRHELLHYFVGCRHEGRKIDGPLGTGQPERFAYGSLAEGRDTGGVEHPTFTVERV